MSVVAFIRRCLDAGMPLDMVLTAAEAHEAEPVAAPRSKGAERQSRYRERHAASQVTESDVVTPCDEGSPPPSFPPRPPKPPTPTPGYTTGARRVVAFAKPNGFARFWEAYPRKVAKGSAEKAYAKAICVHGGPDPPGDLLAALERVKPTWTEPQFIPHASTWLNEKRWEDEPEPRHERPAPQPSGKFAARQANMERAFAGSQAAARILGEPSF